MLQRLVALQQRDGYISKGAAAALAQQLDISIAEIDAVIDFYDFLHHDYRGQFEIRFSDNITDQFAGSRELMAQLCQRLGVEVGRVRGDGRVLVDTTSCTGMSDQGPALLVNGFAIARLNSMRIERVAELIEQGTELSTWPAELFDIQTNIRRTDSQLQSPLPEGAALTALQQQGGEALLADIEASGVRGRGGAGFPTGRKWRYCRQSEALERIVVCNADEGEPGTFKDRVLLQRYAADVIEGMTLAGAIVGARRGFIYLRGEYRFLLSPLESLLMKRRAAGLLGESILGDLNWRFEIEIHLGAGAYICGEESALIESLEGKRGIPRKRPPFPVSAGYRGLPTVVNNVETFFAAARIAHYGSEWFRRRGSSHSTGTKLLSISGDCELPGLYEYPFGVSIAQVLADCGATEVQAVQIAGAAGQTLAPIEFERAIDCEDASTGGSLMIFNRQRDMVQVARNFSHFFAHESCGFCTPCRVGTALLRDGIDKLERGEASCHDLRQLDQIATLLHKGSHCGLGQTAANPVLDLLNNFPASYQQRLRASDYEPAFNLQAALSESGRLRHQPPPPIATTLSAEGGCWIEARSLPPIRIDSAVVETVTDSSGADSVTSFNQGEGRFTLDGEAVPFRAGETIMAAAARAGHYIPHLCYHPDLPASGSCRLCLVKMDGRVVSSCTQPALNGAVVEHRSGDMMAWRRQLLQLLFVEGNHYCPGCEQSGRCQLQAVAYSVGMISSSYPHFYPRRLLDASHPDVVLDFNRCILCGLCVAASRELDHKRLFTLRGRGIATRVAINSESGQLAESGFEISDRAAQLCPVGVFLERHRGYDTPIGERLYDREPIAMVGDIAPFRAREVRYES